jgi:hypothetical protein
VVGAFDGSYKILDPGPGTSGVKLTTRYSAFYDVKIYRRGPQSRDALSIGGHSPVELLVTDPQGRQTGYDQSSGTILEDIPDSSYEFEQGIGDSGGILPPLPGVHSFGVNSPIPGTYTVDVLGTGSGPYSVIVSNATSVGDVTEQTFSGTASPGSRDEYQVQIAGAAVGGIAELPNVSSAALRASSSGSNYRLWSIVLVVILGGGLLMPSAWYVRRRLR